MFCTNCGKELGDGAQFCTNCGASVSDGDGGAPLDQDPVFPIPDQPQADAGQSGAAAAMPASVAPDAASGQTVALERQLQQPEQVGAKKGLPVAAVIAAAVALAVAAAAATVFVLGPRAGSDASPASSALSQPASSLQDNSASASLDPQESSEQPASSSAVEPSSSIDVQPELTEEEKALKGIEGWWAGRWHKPGYLPAFGHIHDGLIDWYNVDYDYDTNTDSVDYVSTVKFDRVERFDENGTQGWRFFTDASLDKSWAYYLADDDQNTLPIYMVADGYGVISETHTDHPTRFGLSRIIGQLDQGISIGTQEQFDRAKALAAERAEQASAAVPSVPEEAFDQEAAEREAREAAEKAGKQLFTGRVIIVDMATRAAEVGHPNAISTKYGNPTNAILILDQKVSATGTNPDGATNKTTPYITREIESLLLSQHDFRDSEEAVLAPWRQYEGQTVTVACSMLGYADDVSGVLYNATAKDVEVIAPLTEDDVKAKASVAESAGDYVLADSNTRTYSRSELEELDNHTLFLARNEIYARHGRGFKNEELRSYFAGKPWYTETVSPDAFSESVLNGTEKANANLMLDIEKSRNSPYV